MWLGSGNSFDACNLNLVNQQSERTETLMRGFNTGFSTTAADADVIWQLNERQEEKHSLGLFSALTEWAAEALRFEGLFEKKKILYSYRYNARIRRKQQSNSPGEVIIIYITDVSNTLMWETQFYSILSLTVNSDTAVCVAHQTVQRFYFIYLFFLHLSYML